MLIIQRFMSQFEVSVKHGLFKHSQRQLYKITQDSTVSDRDYTTFRIFEYLRRLSILSPPPAPRTPPPPPRQIS